MKPEPGKHQHEHHAGKTKAKPAGKVDHVSIVREDPSQKEKQRDVKRRYKWFNEQ